MGKLVTPADVLRSASATVSGTSVVSLTSVGDLQSAPAGFAGSGDVSQVPRWTNTGNVTAIQGIKSDIDLTDDVINYQSGDVFSFPSGLPSGWALLGFTTLEYDGAGPELTQLTDFRVQRPTFLPDDVSRVIATIVVDTIRPDAFGILKNDLFASQVTPYTFSIITQPVGANPPIVSTSLDGTILIDATNADVGSYFAEYNLSENSIPAGNNPGRINIDVTAFAEMPYMAALREYVYEGIGPAVIAANNQKSDAHQLGTNTIWFGTSLLHRLCARGGPQIIQPPGIPNPPFAYAFNGDRARLTYDNSMQRSTSYVHWECAHDPINPANFYMCTTPGITAASAPSLDRTTAEVTETIDGSVVWTFIGNPNDNHSGNVLGWDDVSDEAHSLYCHRKLGGRDCYFYDTANTALSWRQRLIDRGEGTQADIDFLDWAGGLMIDHERSRNQADDYRKHNETPYFILHHQLTTITGGLKYDLESTNRYKGRGLTELIDIQGIITSGQYSGNNGVGLVSGPVTTINFTEGAYTDAQNVAFVMQESAIREISYMFKNWVDFKQATWNATGVLEWPTFTASLGQITTPVIAPRFYLALLFQYCHMVMNGLADTPGGWAPFMKGLLANSLVKYTTLMEAAGEDPNQYVDETDYGVDYNFTWSRTQMHGICQPWPTIAAMCQDFFYWMRHTATEDGNSALMWQQSIKGFKYRSSNAYDAADLNGLIAIAYYFTAKLVDAGAPIVPGTHSDTSGWVADGDEIWEGAIEGFTYSNSGKPINQFLGYSTDTINMRNQATGRND